jgi:hypothetical protein
LALKENPAYLYYFETPKAEKGNKEKAIDYISRLGEIKKRNSTIFERIDYDGTLIRLVESGYFNTSKETPIISARKSNFEEAIGLISIDNAKF